MLSAGPGSNTPPSWLDGSNCQRFAYGVLALFGLACPPLWSSELWDDRAATAVVQDPEPLDLMLYNKTADPFSAHVAVWMAPGGPAALCHADRPQARDRTPSQIHKSIISNGPCLRPHRQPSPTTGDTPPSRNSRLPRLRDQLHGLSSRPHATGLAGPLGCLTGRVTRWPSFNAFVPIMHRLS
jgi:hypothetical protein